MKKITLFEVLPKEIAYFQHIESQVLCVPVKAILINQKSEAINNSLKYRYPLKYLGKQAEELIVLCIPARQHQINSTQNYKPQLPFLIKTAKQTNTRGYLSGRRSAIFIEKDKLIRYKGCGNDGQGFIYQDKQLRGSHFYHTAKRQIYMTQLINKVLLQQIHQTSANRPLFFYQFPKSITNFGLKNDIKLLNKYCCVFQTQGDRRIGTHLISPLQILFVNLLDTSGLDLQNHFKEKKRLDQYGIVELLVNYELFLEKGQIFLQKLDKSTSFQNYVGLKDIQALGEPKLAPNFNEIINKISIKFIKQEPINLNELLTNKINWISIIGIILQKIGWEMGQIKRIFCQKNINWGFFNDHGHWHCNAHLNNFILRKPQINSRFTLPLDFDLSFTKNEFINIDLTSEKYGEQDDDVFQQMLLAEFNAMETSVSGIEIMNFKYSIDLEQKEQGPTQVERMLRVVFRDTLIKSFREGMKRNKLQYDRINKDWNQNIDSITKLIECCLHISGQSQT